MLLKSRFFLGNEQHSPDDLYARYSHCAGTFLSTLCVLNGLLGANNTYSIVDSVRCRDDMVSFLSLISLSFFFNLDMTVDYFRITRCFYPRRAVRN